MIATKIAGCTPIKSTQNFGHTGLADAEARFLAESNMEIIRNQIDTLQENHRNHPLYPYHKDWYAQQLIEQNKTLNEIIKRQQKTISLLKQLPTNE